MSLERALTSAPCSSSRRVLSKSVAAHISAVALASFRLLQSAPSFSSFSSVDGLVYNTAYMKGVEPSGPRALSSLGSADGGPEESLKVACAQRLDHGNGLGIERRQVGLIRQRVRPFGALVDPTLDGLDLLGAERAGGRHLHSVCIPGDAMEQEAVLTAAGHHAAAIDHRALAIDAKAADLLGRAVAGGRSSAAGSASRLSRNLP